MLITFVPVTIALVTVVSAEGGAVALDGGCVKSALVGLNVPVVGVSVVPVVVVVPVTLMPVIVVPIKVVQATVVLVTVEPVTIVQY